MLYNFYNNITKTSCLIKGQEVYSSRGTTLFLSLPHDNKLGE